MKKINITLTAAICLALFLLAGCGKPAETPVKETIAESTSLAIETEVPETEAPETASATAAPETVTEESSKEDGRETSVSFGLEETVLCEGLCEMSGLYAEVLDDAAKEQGWYYYYTDTDQSPAETISWEVSEENYTTVEALFSAKNISEEPQIFGDKITAQMRYRENPDSPEVCFQGTVFQQNPGQVDAGGEMIMWSTKPTEIDAGESANVSFRFDIPKDVYEKVYAAACGENTEITETCEFTFGDGITYVIDLSKALIPASLYE